MCYHPTCAVGKDVELEALVLMLLHLVGFWAMGFADVRDMLI